jgi:predicted negative regulator of RcsB-dependent stress response
MQTQDAPAEIIFKLWPWIEANKNRLIGALTAIIILAGILFFVSSQREQKEIAAGQALTALLVSPAANAGAGQMTDALAKLAGQYAGTAAGQRAQLQAAAALFNAGRYADAQTQFQKFLDASPASSLAATAELGVAASLEAQNKTDAAVGAYQKVVSSFAGSASDLPAEFALGRIAEQQNKLNEALGHYEIAARASLGGTLAQEAAQRAFDLRNKIAAAPKPATTTPVAK